MQRKLYLFVVAALCSLSAFALDINTLLGADGDGYGVPVPADTSSHRVFHSKFGDDVPFPRLTGNATENAYTLSKFFSEISRRPNTKIETFFSLVPLMPKNGDSVSIETLDKMMPISYRCYYSATMEYLLFYEMGGRNRTISQLIGAFRSETNATFTPLCHKNPDLYCAQLDSVVVFLKNLNYMGDIYPEMKIQKSKEQQDSVVRRLTNAIGGLQEGMRRNAHRDKKFRELAQQLYTDPEHVDLHKYFSEKLCQKFESKELEFSDISPEKTWVNWDVNNNDLCSFSFESTHKFLVILANKKKDENLLDADNTRAVHSYYVDFVQEGDEMLIDDIKVQTVSK